MVKVKSLKIAFVHPDLGIGGAERLVLDVAEALANQGVQVEFITNHFDKTHAFEELKGNKFPVTVIGDKLPRSIVGAFQALCAYFRMLYLALSHYFFLLPSQSPDVYFVDQIPMAVPILRWTGKKVIYYCHHPDLLASPPGGILKRLYRKPIDWLEFYGTKKADYILVNSEYTASIFKKTFPGIKKDIEILYPTIASTFLSDIKKAAKKPIQTLVPDIVSKAKLVVFLSINRYHPAKELELAINAMEKLREVLDSENWKRVYLIMAGGYDPQSTINATYFKKLVQLAASKDLSDKVIFLKSPSDKLKADLLKSCDCLIYTPTNEHFGIVPLEAMAAAKPVIACNSGGPRETVENDVTGYLCDPKAESLATSMAKILEPDLQKKMGLLGLKRLQNLFSIDTFSDKCMDIVAKSYAAK